LKVWLGSSQNTAITDANGLASLAPSTGAFSRPLEVEMTASAGIWATLQFELPMLSANGAQSRREHRESARSGAIECPF
jgi:hypothetical protein